VNRVLEGSRVKLAWKAKKDLEDRRVKEAKTVLQVKVVQLVQLALKVKMDYRALKVKLALKEKRA
jgi:hypothetical protein